MFPATELVCQEAGPARGRTDSKPAAAGPPECPFPQDPTVCSTRPGPPPAFPLPPDPKTQQAVLTGAATMPALTSQCSTNERAMRETYAHDHGMNPHSPSCRCAARAGAP